MDQQQFVNRKAELEGADTEPENRPRVDAMPENQ